MEYNDSLKKEEKNLENFVLENGFNEKEVVLLEKNENSFLAPVCKDATQEFFEKIFSPEGPFWQAYKELGMGELPLGKKYIQFVSNQAYFCKNIENNYIYSVGPKMAYFVKNHENESEKRNDLERNTNNFTARTGDSIAPKIKNEKITPIVNNEGINAYSKKPISLDWIIRTISAPIDSITQTKNTMVNAFKINELFMDFEDKVNESKELLLKQESKTFTIEDARNYQNKAVEVMKYSFLASLAYSLKLKPNQNLLPVIEETKSFFEGAKNPKGKKEYSFLGKNLYDISSPRIGEDNKLMTPIMTLPSEEWMILRESAKIACARYLYLQRLSYLAISKELELGEEIFFIKTEELTPSKKPANQELKKLAAERKTNYLKNKELLLSSRIIYAKKWFMEGNAKQGNSQKEIFSGVNAGAKKIVKAPIGWVKGETDLKKDFSGKIIATNYFSPNLVVAYKGALGVISTVGGSLSHPAIIAREKEMPCILQVEGLLELKEGDILELDGTTGKAKLVK
ncbi:MAG: PEP-utilizing enzyme [Candidatus Diapherotrites archaeon]|nr:PEP-utilizing enzyme [Candidatus Diapherotrites archaeon]